MNRIRDFDETELLVKLQQGDHKAFESIYDVHQSRITAHLMRLLKSEELAKEVVQDTFLALWEHRDWVEIDKPVGAYLYRIATNKPYNLFKRAILDEKLWAYLYPAIEAGYDHIETQLLNKEKRKPTVYTRNNSRDARTPASGLLSL